MSGDFDLVINSNYQIDANSFWMNLSANENAIEILEKYKSHINWSALSLNKNAVHLLEINLDKINWNNLMQNEGATNLLKDYIEQNEEIENQEDFLRNLSKNKSKFAMEFIDMIIVENYGIDVIDAFTKINISKNESVHAVNLMKKYPKLIDWKSISSNKGAMDIIKPNLQKIDISEFCENENEFFMFIIEKYKNYDMDWVYSVDWEKLSGNKYAMDLLITHMNYIYWKKLSKNENAVYLLKKNLKQIDWSELSKNKSKNAIDLLKQNQKKIDWVNLAKNENKKVIPLLMKFVKRMFVSDVPETEPEPITLKPPQQQLNYYFFYNGEYSIYVDIIQQFLHLPLSLKKKEQIIDYIQNLNFDFCRKVINTSYLTLSMIEKDVVFYVENTKHEILGCIVCEIQQDIKKNELRIPAFCTPRSTGSGKILLHFCIKFGKILGCDKITLSAAKSAISFYKKNGFTFVHEEDDNDYFSNSNSAQDLVPMEYIYSKKRKREEEEEEDSPFEKKQKIMQKRQKKIQTRQKKSWSLTHFNSTHRKNSTVKKRNTI